MNPSKNVFIDFADFFLMIPELGICVRRDLTPAMLRCPDGLAEIISQLGGPGGTLPGAPEVAVGLVINAYSVQIVFNCGKELIAAGAVAWQSGELATSLWLWLWESMSGAQSCHEAPALRSQIWAAVSLSQTLGGRDNSTGTAVYEFTKALAPAIVAWAARQN